MSPSGLRMKKIGTSHLIRIYYFIFHRKLMRKASKKELLEVFRSQLGAEEFFNGRLPTIAETTACINKGMHEPKSIRNFSKEKALGHALMRTR